MKKIIGLTVVSCPVWAQSEVPEPFDIATTLGSLLFVIALILFLGWLLKRMRLPSMGQQKGLSIVRQLPVGTKERVMIIQAGEEQFLIGATAQSIQLIAKLETPLAQEESSTAPFATQLSQLLKKHDKSSS
ncbi:flagellar biosynthetic protein FliO [Vibrio sp. CAIM 722]|uniref:Flagellar protein n=1 Tax=Vibrio eleionomae TaxID=2653505 RepID=A0A7X4LHJ0_9VIBR|nr:flagellar biosynthetic protein FliO [Vibrio eleionomae]MZI92070.1 flagellar biosynthetic protein FliO [Vibrio eleionomae]